MASLDRLERLTDLVLVLLGSSRPLTLGEIAREVPGYPASHDARRQAFERDKRLLRQEGIPVLTESVEGPEQYGYRIDPDSFYLPDLHLEPDEQAALHLAVAGVHLGDPSGRQALLKLGATGVVEAAPVALLAPPSALVALFDALRAHAEVRFTYRGERRQVAPAGVRFRRGRWYVVGWDRDRSAGRSFRVDRIEGPPEAGAPGSGELPEGFDVDAAAPDEPVRPVAGGDESEVEVRVDAVEALRVVDEVGAAAVKERRPDGSVVLRLGVTMPDAMRSWVLGLLDHAEVLGPPAAREAMVAWLTALADGPSLEPPAASAPAPASSGEPPAPDRTGTGVGEGGEVSARDPRHRLRRLLAIVGWLARVGRAPLHEVAARFGIPEDEVVRELELAACCGIPPYSPDALLEIVVTDDEVEAFLPEDLARPRRLTAGEGFALAAAARTILAVPGADESGALARALAKLEGALGDQGTVVVDLDEPALLAAVRGSTDRGASAELEYHSASTDETSVRVVDPLAVVALDGHWYLDAHCHSADGLRRFRVDRIRSWRELGEHERSAGDGERRDESRRDESRRDGRERRERERERVGPEAFVPGPGAVMVRLLLDPAAAWVLESVPLEEVRPLRAGWHEVVVAVGGRAWLERLLLQLGPHAGVLSPPDLVAAGADAARKVLRHYRQTVPTP